MGRVLVSRSSLQLGLVAVSLLSLGIGTTTDVVAFGDKVLPSPPTDFGLKPTTTGENRGGFTVFVGTSFDVVIFGTNGADELHGLGGCDRICSLDGNDVIQADLGNDRINPSAGNETVDGGPAMI